MKTKLLLSAFFLLSVSLSYGQWTYTDLSEAKCQMGSTALGTKAYFAGGNNGTEALSAVEIYDIENEDWDSIIQLSQPRFFPACAAAGNKVFFAGGINFFTMEHFDKVDIWNADAKEWTEVYLSEARMTSTVSKGNKVLFAGGVNVQTGQVSDRVDIFHFSTYTWTIAYLTEARAFLAATVSGSKIVIAGGTNASNNPSDRVDIYDTVTGQWTTETLSEPLQSTHPH